MLKTGDIVLLDFPYTNRTGSRVRPGLVIGINQSSIFDELNVAFITTEVDSYIYDTSAVQITATDLAEGTLKQESMVRVDKVITVQSTICRKVASLNTTKLDEVLRKATAFNVENFAVHKFNTTAFVPGTSVIPPSGKVLGVEELKNMVEASLDGWLTTGRFNAEFEKKLAKFIGVKHLITVNSGSSANLVAFMTLTSPKLGDRAIKPGDEVIGVAAGFPTTVNPILQFGAVPVFVDVDPRTHNIDAGKIEAAIGPKTKAIMLAHSLGNPFNLDVVTALCKKHHLWLIEDCCDALGTTYRGQMVGTFDHKYTYSHLGYNLKITDMQAACGVAQLDKAPQFIQARKYNFAFLKERLKNCVEFLQLPKATERSDSSWFGFPITLKKLSCEAV